MRGSPLQFEKILQTLQKHNVLYILIGGVCAVLHGSSMNTGDIDIVPLRDAGNLDRLAAALTDMQAYYREHPPFKIVPTAQRLDTPGHHLLMTHYGPIDILGTIVGQRDYPVLVPDTVEVQVDELRVRMLSLPILIEIKRETGRVKDLLAVSILQELLKMQSA